MRPRFRALGPQAGDRVDVIRGLPLGLRCVATLLIVVGGASAAAMFTEQQARGALLILSVGGCLCGLVGCAAMVSRIRVQVDGKCRVIHTWWGIGKPFLKVHTRSLDGLRAVALSHPRGSLRPRRCGCYPVLLLLDRANYLVEDSWEYSRARRLALSLARCLQVSVCDETAVTALPEGNDSETLLARPQDLMAPVGRAIPPDRLQLSQLEIHSDSCGILVRIPAAGVSIREVASALLGAGGVAVAFMRARLSFALGASMIWIVWALGLLSVAACREETRICNQWVRHTRRGLLRRDEQSIEAKEVSDVEIAFATTSRLVWFVRRRKVVRIIGSNRVIETGGQLMDGELVLLCMVMRAALRDGRAEVGES